MATNKMGKIVAVANEKGGAGKTTTACQVAGALGLRGYDVLVADCDSQQTSSQWIAAKGGENFRGSCWQGHQYKEAVAKQLGQLVSKYDIIVVDCAPSVEQGSTWGALLVCDLAIIPTRLNPQDLAALPAAKRLIKKAWDQAGREFPVRVLPVAARMHMPDDRAALNHLQNDSVIPLAKSTFGDRKAYPRSMLIGGTVHGLPKQDESVREVEAFTDEVLKLIGLPATNERLAA